MKLKHVLHYFILQQYYFLGLTQALGIGLLTLYFLFGIQSTAMDLGSLISHFGPLLFLQQLIFFWLQRHNIDPKKERGLFLRSKLLSFAVWPIYLLALFSVISKKRLTYKVTPKGNKQQASANPSLFFPHLLLGGLSLYGILISFATHHQALQLMFWGILNSFTLLYFVLSESTKKAVETMDSAMATIYRALRRSFNRNFNYLISAR